MNTGNDEIKGGGCAAPPCSQKRATPDADRALTRGANECWHDFVVRQKQEVENLERERDAALARESALLEFMEVEMGWEYFRAEYQIGDSPSQSLQNAKKLKEFLSANNELCRRPE